MRALPRDFILVVGTNHELDGFKSSDGCEELMREFFKELDFKYQEPFVCTSVRAPIPATRPGARRRTKTHPADAYGPPHVLKPEILDRATLACAGDFQNVMSKAFIDYSRNGTPLTNYKRFFRPLAGLTDTEKRDAIFDVHQLLLQKRNRFGRYVEVRVQGPAEADWSDSGMDGFDDWLSATPDEEELD